MVAGRLTAHTLLHDKEINVEISVSSLYCRISSQQEIYMAYATSCTAVCDIHAENMSIDNVCLLRIINPSCSLERNDAYLPCQAYVVLVYIAVNTKKPKYIAFVSCLGGLVLLIAGNVLVRIIHFVYSTRNVFSRVGSIFLCRNCVPSTVPGTVEVSTAMHQLICTL